MAETEATRLRIVNPRGFGTACDHRASDDNTDNT